MVFNVNAIDREMVDEQCTPQLLDCFTQAIELTGGIETIRDIRYVYATD